MSAFHDYRPPEYPICGRHRRAAVIRKLLAPMADLLPAVRLSAFGQHGQPSAIWHHR
jgi:hypothetical protein